MKKVALFIVMALVVLTLTSCIEVIHVITISNGVVSTQIRYTAQKYLFDMLSLFSTDGVNASDVFDIGEEIRRYPRGVRFFKENRQPLRLWSRDYHYKFLRR